MCKYRMCTYENKYIYKCIAFIEFSDTLPYIFFAFYHAQE